MAALKDANDLLYDDLTNATPTIAGSEAGWDVFKGSGYGSTYVSYRPMRGHDTLTEFTELFGGVTFGWG